MTAVLDHVFILCASGAPEADALLQLGLCEGASNVHPGQGTACRRFFFQNFYLELLWVRDALEAQRPPAKRTRLYARWSGRGLGACPFGVVLRPEAAGDKAPFSTWTYRPSYLPAPFVLEVAKGTRLSEPELFYFPVSRRPRDMAPQPREHALGLGELTAASLTLPGALSRALKAVEALGLLSFPKGEGPLLTLGFGSRPGAAGAKDLRPSLPLVLRW
jgi:Glyoxalase-like domain